MLQKHKAKINGIYEANQQKKVKEKFILHDAKKKKNRQERKKDRKMNVDTFNSWATKINISKSNFIKKVGES